MLARAAIIAALVLAALAGAPEPRAQDAPAGASSLAGFVARLNAARERRGLLPVEADARLSDLAARYAAADAGQTRIDGGRGAGLPRDLAAIGFTNVHMGYGALRRLPSADAALDRWMSDGAVSASLYKSEISLVGLGVATGKDGQPYYALVLASIPPNAEKSPPPPPPAADVFDGCVSRGASPVASVVNADDAVKRVNALRRAEGLPAVRVDPRLTAAAQAYAETMAGADTLDHYIGNRPIDRVMAAGFCHPAGENIARGDATAAAAVASWERSPPHRANLLMRGGNAIGIGAATSPRSRQVYWALYIGQTAVAVASR